MRNTATLKRTASECDQQQRAADPTIWEAAVSDEVSEVRAAYLHRLSRIPTGLGKLAYLAVLQHQLLADHNEMFGEWCCCSLQQKYEWLYRLLVGASCRGVLPDQCLKASIYFDLVPRSADPASRDLYGSELEEILEILIREIGDDCDVSVQGKNSEAEVPTATTVS